MTSVILGGGIGGLATAYYLLKNTSHKVIILEASNRIGGWIRSEKPSDGVVFEQGPRTLRPKGDPGFQTLSLIDELKLGKSIKPILGTDPAAKKRYLYVNQQLYLIQSGFKSVFRAHPPFSQSFIRLILNERKKPTKYLEDDSIYNFVERRFSKEIADYVISPLICGTCGGDAKRISVNFLMEDFFEKEQEYDSITKGFLRSRKGVFNIKHSLTDLGKKAAAEKWNSYFFPDGMETFPTTLSNEVQKKGATIMKNCSVTKLDFSKKIIKTEGEDVPFNYIVNTLPAYTLASLIHDEHYNIAKELNKIPYITMITVNLAYKKNVLGSLDGFGFLVVPSENLPILGITFDSCVQSLKDCTILTVMMGGFMFDTYFKENHSEEFLLKTATEHVNKILNISDSPHLYQVSVLPNCIPQQIVGHKSRMTWILNQIEKEKLPLWLIGNAVRGIGINDVVYWAKIVAENIADYKTEPIKEVTYEVQHI